MLKLNKKEYLDRLHACWIGKNIGGTLGAPYEGNRSFLDVKGFATPEGEPLPNDDLDLQLVWLSAMESVGPKFLTANVLAEYWLEMISPHWNEYGIAKTNLALGLLPPMSGEVDNDKWKTSNGAWIRSEIWAGMAPAAPDVAVKYAVMDASVDHGLTEGTYAEIFTASLQSAAYAESDINILLETALAKIPEECMTSKTVRLVIEAHKNGENYRDVREKIVEFNRELGWFQAPANLGFVTIGLLYGEGDFKKSMLYAVNCGDDTDCTAATVGATLGIIGGTAGIPEDWKSFIGDKIVTLCIGGSYSWRAPKTCKELTERVSALTERVLNENGVNFAFTDGATELDCDELKIHNVLTSADFTDFSPYSYDINTSRTVKAKIEYDKSPRVKPGDTRKIKITFKAENTGEPRKLHMRLILPEGWQSSAYDRNIALEYPQPGHNILGKISTEFTVTAGDTVNEINRAYAEITCSSLPSPIMLPLTFIG